MLTRIIRLIIIIGFSFSEAEKKFPPPNATRDFDYQKKFLALDARTGASVEKPRDANRYDREAD